ncbi:hypothetical protein LWI29_021260 [Acer saccharum]|uniref:Retrotransposon gag domain-containing protein n=1 Tax=Acer saccharum TaxID=4024 RepID=A0AA39SFG7_ACESA|nr:hypothetical protein LWI29_021260 [Acer saccharum]
MAKMAKELEELRKGKHQGTRKNPLGEMNAPFSRRIREAELPPKFKMLTKKYSGSEDPERGETLRSYVEKFHKKVIQMGVFTEKETLANFRRNLWADRLFRSFAKHPPETYQEAYDRALEQVDIDEQL